MEVGKVKERLRRDGSPGVGGSKRRGQERVEEEEHRIKKGGGNGRGWGCFDGRNRTSDEIGKSIKRRAGKSKTAWRNYLWSTEGRYEGLTRGKRE